MRPLPLFVLILILLFTSDYRLSALDYSDSRGVVVESLEDGSQKEVPGIEPGDRLIFWRKLPSSLGHFKQPSGWIEDIFEWELLRVDILPQGCIVLTISRSGILNDVYVIGESRTLTARPYLPPSIAVEYSKASALLEVEPASAASQFYYLATKTGIENDKKLICWLLVRSGRAWKKAKVWNNALHSFKSALEIASTPAARVLVQEEIANTLQARGDNLEAESYYLMALRLRQDHWGTTLGAARGTYNLGVIAWRRRDLDLAESRLNSAASTQEALAPNTISMSQTLNALASLALTRNKLDLAETHLKRSASILESLAPHSPSMASTLNNLGVLAKDRGNLDEAEKYYKRALEIYEQQSLEEPGAAASLNNLGVLANDRGDLRKAIDYYERALSLKLRLEPNSLSLLGPLNNLGGLALDRGDLQLAESFFEHALRIGKERAARSLEVASTLTNLGNVHSRRGDLDLAQDYHSQALGIQLEVVPDSLDVSRSMNNLGAIAWRRGELEKAKHFYLQALSAREKTIPKSLGVATNLANIGSFYAKTGNLAEAEIYMKRALDLRKALAPESMEVARSLNNLGALAWVRGDLDLAELYSRDALQIQEKLAPRSTDEAETLQDLAHTYWTKDQLTNATTLSYRAIEALESQIHRLGGSQDDKAQFRMQFQHYYQELMEMLLAQNRTAEAFNVLERSRSRSLLAMLAERELTFRDIDPALNEMRRQAAITYDRVQKALLEADPHKEKDRIDKLALELRKARLEHEEVIEKIRQTSPRFASLRYPQPIDLASTKELLDPGTLILSYSVGKEKTYLFALSKLGQLHVEALEIGQEQLEAEVQSFRDLIARSRGIEARSVVLRQLGYRLCRTLLEPVTQKITTSDRLLVIPDGPLHRLPWHSLVCKTYNSLGHEKESRYLSEWKPLHLAPSLTVYREFGDLKHRAVSEDPSNIILAAFASPLAQAKKSNNDAMYFRTRSFEVDGLNLSPLPATQTEVEQIVRLYSSETTKTYFGAEATEESAKSLPRNTRIVHFAAHATLDERFPLNSAIILSIPEKFEEGKDNGLLQAWEIFERIRIDADLVVLSACESGLGKEMGGEGLIGLTRAFQYAGARSVMASLWKISDRTTAELMVRFYKNLKAGKPKDEALRAAQMELIQGPIQVKNEKGEIEEIDASAPYYWAAFQIYGDWQ